MSKKEIHSADIKRFEVVSRWRKRISEYTTNCEVVNHFYDGFFSLFEFHTDRYNLGIEIFKNSRRGSLSMIL